MKLYSRIYHNIVKQLYSKYIYIYISKEKKKTDNPVLKNPPDSTRNMGLMIGPGIFHMLWGD